MSLKHIHRKIQHDPKKVAERKALREKLQSERPTLAQVQASGDYEEPISLQEYVELRHAAHALKVEREKAGLSISQLAERAGIDKAALSRLESGQHSNPTVHTLFRLAAALGKRIRLVLDN